MTRTADHLVTEFCKLWSSPNLEVRDDRIAVWRDYFDMAAITKAFG